MLSSCSAWLIMKSFVTFLIVALFLMVNSKSKIKENNSTIRFKFATTNSKSKDFPLKLIFTIYEINIIISYIENGGENE